MGRPAAPPTHGAAAPYGPMQGARRWVRSRRPSIPCLGRRNATHQKTERGGKVVALGGRRFVNRHNNQPKFGYDGGGDIGEGAQPWRNVCGGCFGCVWGGELSDKK